MHRREPSSQRRRLDRAILEPPHPPTPSPPEEAADLVSRWALAGASPGLVASPLAATGASARRLTMNQQAGPKSTASRGGEGEQEYQVLKPTPLCRRLEGRRVTMNNSISYHPGQVRF
jgi:hypothetical protein